MRVRLYLLAVIALAGCATSQTEPPRARTFFYENDTFHGSDDAYTSGVRYATMKEGHVPLWARSFMSHVDPKPYKVSFGWTFGQQFYTPYSITEKERITDDRPYAGWLFVGWIAQAQLAEKSRHYLELDVGIVGPSARGESTQDFIHEYVVCSAPEPEGWRFQVRDEGAGVLRYRYDRRLGIVRSRFDYDATINTGFVLGNVPTFINAGATFRVGINLRGFLPDKMSPSMINPMVVESGIRRFKRWSNDATLYVFIRPEWRGVAHNLLVEGNHPESRNVTARRDVMDFDKGIGFGGRWWELTLAIVQRSPEFTKQERGQSFISAQLTIMTRR